MKKLILIRHAKSSWSDPYLSDSERPLSDRGRRDAPLMAELLAGESEPPDLILCSSSKRTRQTIKYFLDRWGNKSLPITYTDSLYHASTNQLLSIIRRLDEGLNTVAIVGHNPGLTYLVQELVNFGAPNNIPTCGLAIIESGSEYWSNFDAGNPVLVKYFYPKRHLDIY